MTHVSLRASRKPGRACAQGKAFAWRMWSEAGWRSRFRRISFGLDFVLLRRKSPVRTRCSAPTLRESRSQSRQRAASAIAVASSFPFASSPIRAKSEVRPRSAARQPLRGPALALHERVVRRPRAEGEAVAGAVDARPDEFGCAGDATFEMVDIGLLHPSARLVVAAVLVQPWNRVRLVAAAYRCLHD